MSLLEQVSPRYRVSAFGCEFTVLGIPQSGGSKRPVRRGGKASGKLMLIDMNEEKVKPWRNAAKMIAAELMRGRDPYEGPLMLAVEFHMPRPKGHFGVHGVRRSAPSYPTVRPDSTKLLRPLEDALTGILWNDDSQIVEQIIRKRYGDPPRAEIRVAVIVT